MAYTPFETVWGANAARASGFIENIPILERRGGKVTIPPALTSLVWIFKLNEIQRVHEYLDILLSCRRRFPSLKPAWRNWGSDIGHSFYTPLGYSYNGMLEDEDIDWLHHCKSDRQIVEVFQAFDGLLERGHSTAQHLVLVRLLIDDLSDEEVATDDNYYTGGRKSSLKALKDPVLRLIGARAAGIAYSGPLPPLEDDSRHDESWVEALGYWCRHFEVVDAEPDEGLIVAVLSHPNPALYSVLLRSSSRNATLRDELRQILESRLNESSDTNATLLLHTVARTTSWFPEYMKPANLAKVIEILRSNTPVTLRVLPFLAFLISFLSTPEDLKVITTTTQTTLLNAGPDLRQNEANEIYSAFGGILQDPPQWIQALQNSNIDLWREALESMRGILDIIRTQDDSLRAVLRWNGRPHPVSAQDPSEVSPQGDSDGNQDHDRMWLERLYSCAASWDI